MFPLASPVISRGLTFRDSGQMRKATSSSRSKRRASQYRRTDTPPLQSGLDQEERDRLAFKASPIECPSQVFPLQDKSAPTTPPSVTPTTGDHGPPNQVADGDHTPCVVNLGPVEQVAMAGGPEMAAADIKRVPLLAHAEGAIGASREGVENASDFKADGEKIGADEPTSSICTGSDTTQSIVTEAEKARLQFSEMARPPSGLLHDTATDSYPRGPYDPWIGADEEDVQMDFSTPMDKDDDESDTRFGVLSNTTFHPLLTYQPHLYGNGFNVEQDVPIVEDIGSSLGADSVMEDATPKSRKVDVRVAATRSHQPFSWVPPSTSDALHALFPGVPYARPQVATFVDDSAPGFQHCTLNNPYGVDTTISEETRIQQVAPPQHIAWPLVLDGAYPSPTVEGGLSKGPQFGYAKHSSSFGPSVFPSQTASHSSFMFPSPLTLRVDPVPISSPTCRPIEVHQEVVKGLEGDVCPEPAVVANVQRETSPPRSV